MLATSNHDELAEQRFVVALKGYLFAELEPPLQALTRETAASLEATPAPRRHYRMCDDGSRNVRSIKIGYRACGQRRRLMWQAAGDCVDRQESRLEQLAAAAPPVGTLRTDPDFKVPRYLTATDTHMMPGSYHTDPTGRSDVRQGALFDKGASLYSLGRQGGQMNDMRGNTVVAHLFERFPALETKAHSRDRLYRRQQPRCRGEHVPGR